MATWSELSRESFRAARLAMGHECYRSSVSRSYYSAYAAVAQVLVDKGLLFAGDKKGPPHRHVRELIENNIGNLKPKGVRRVRAAEKRMLKAALNILYENRLDADYHPGRTVELDMARNSLAAASRVAGALGITI